MSNQSGSIYVLELAEALVPKNRREPGCAGYVYVGQTAKAPEVRRDEHANGKSGKAAAIFRRVVADLGRPLNADELRLRPDLVTVTPNGQSKTQIERAERSQANKLGHGGYVVLSSHEHATIANRRAARRR